jgi:hypothetical protein
MLILLLACVKEFPHIVCDLNDHRVFDHVCRGYEITSSRVDCTDVSFGVFGYAHEGLDCREIGPEDDQGEY